jgi:hypothetical protein
MRFCRAGYPRRPDLTLSTNCRGAVGNSKGRNRDFGGMTGRLARIPSDFSNWVRKATRPP